MKTKTKTNGLFNVAFAKADTVWFPRGCEVIKISTNCGDYVGDVKNADERVNMGILCVKTKLEAAGIDSQPPHPSKVLQVFGRTTVLTHMTVHSTDRTILAKLISEANSYGS